MRILIYEKHVSLWYEVSKGGSKYEACVDDTCMVRWFLSSRRMYQIFEMHIFQLVYFTHVHYNLS